ncbi:low temperature requirement protein A [Leucobacter luti]|uniref:Low temperature requirement protein LtrA n=1 Tax=Leucobacter luti TaxID=340320 RepID=A0A4Q7TR84_9MICO|nr:low temperature requirement protein A [Leucobacter luti]MBL3699987.1 low temperature requirement protein A [Leucobacter luti]RZT62697.1 low temperature requirement protein LtrA [Leucobacter luti]
MSTATARRFGVQRMAGRDPHEPHRVASPLELFFDLVFVIAVSQASQSLHHGIVDGHAATAVTGYAMVFFAIWWAWMNFTWFASAFDTDDWLYRVTTILQMGGVLVLAAGAQAALADGEWAAVTWGYVIMRLAMVIQWCRAAASDPRQRTVALRYAVGISCVQLVWVARLALPGDAQFWSFWPAMLLELLVPVWAERSRRTPWHPHHIAERYSLFVLILLGESLLASANAVIGALHAGTHGAGIVGLAVAGLLLAAGIWWLYFSDDHGERLTGVRTGFGVGYAHYFIFAAVGALSAGIEVELDLMSGEVEQLSGSAASFALAVPVFVFMVTVWAVLLRHKLSSPASAVFLACALAVLASAALPVVTVLGTTACVVIAVATVEIGRARRTGAAAM